jgi:hypothetical protein
MQDKLILYLEELLQIAPPTKEQILLPRPKDRTAIEARSDDFQLKYSKARGPEPTEAWKQARKKEKGEEFQEEAPQGQ